MITVNTKQLIKNGKWNCSCTFQCYDHLEVDDTIEGAQKKFKDLLERLGATDEIFFEEPKPYKEEPPVIGYYVQPVKMAINRIDKGIV
jgi:hypothetical protein